MKRREFMAAIGCSVISWWRVANAQTTPKIYRIGVLSPSGPYTNNTPFGTPLLHGLAQQGYVQCANVEFEQRAAEGHLDRLPNLVDELAANKVDVLITGGYPPALAAKRNGAIPALRLAFVLN
jgi:hypothetical protein